MSQVYKQMIVMLMSIAFIGIVAVLVLSSTAAAGYVDPYTTASIRDSNLRTADRVLSGDYYQAPTYQTSDNNQLYNDRMDKIEREKEMREYMNRPEIMGGPAPRVVYVYAEQSGDYDQYESDHDDGYDKEYSGSFTSGIIALIVLLIVLFILYHGCVWIEEKTSHTYKPDTSDTTDRIRLTPKEMDVLDVFMDSNEYKQTSNKDMAVNFKVNQIVANRTATD